MQLLLAFVPTTPPCLATESLKVFGCQNQWRISLEIYISYTLFCPLGLLPENAANLTFFLFKFEHFPPILNLFKPISFCFMESLVSWRPDHKFIRPQPKLTQRWMLAWKAQQIPSWQQIPPWHTHSVTATCHLIQGGSIVLSWVKGTKLVSEGSRAFCPRATIDQR